MFVERSAQYTSFRSRKQPANAGTERKQFTENASVALQQPILTHAHTKCPPVAVKHIQRQEFSFTKTSIKENPCLCFKPASRCLLFSKMNLRQKIAQSFLLQPEL